ncbi:MAG: type II toxin-antitoxin system VapC family toxin [Chloroflexi bacterium]|nr:type II toxin-antitoxin system VapC family toxin [Chloroflexota bacterium]
MIYLDTHIVIWLYAGLTNKFSPLAQELINEHEIAISPIVRLELRYLHGISRVTEDANAIATDLSSRIGLKTCNKEFASIINQAMAIAWTRDPFDRIIVGNASLNNNILITKDQKMLDHYPYARWE